MNKSHYLKNFKELLSTNHLYMQNNVANGHTLYNLSQKIYDKDLTLIKSKLPGQGNCSSAIKYMKEYTTILKEINRII